jgi:hypothetical protein
VGLHGQIGRIVVGTALLIGAASVPAPAHAHFVLVKPDSWMSQSLFCDPQKLGACGDEGGGTATGKVTAFRPGETIEINAEKSFGHPSTSSGRAPPATQRHP